MCINPVLLPNGQEVACHHCWQCVRRKIDDWTGRCIAESQTAAITRSVTLTYGRDNRYGSADHIKAAVLTYSDVQKYLRSMRDAGYIVRYFVVGEYGSRKGRAHWHLLLFFYGTKLPLRPLDRQFEDDHWPHGFSFWQMATPEAVQYVTKYIAKEVDSEERQYHQGLSKLPPLGDEWFKQYAGRYVAAGLAPQDLYYSFEHVRDRKQRTRVFMMREATADNFCQAFLEQWWQVRGDHPPNSDLLEEYEDRLAVAGTPEAARRIIALEKHGALKLRDVAKPATFTGVIRKPMDSDYRSWMDPAKLKYSEQLHCWYYEFEGDQAPWYWARDPDGVWSWRAKIGAGHPTQARSYRDRKIG